MPGAVFLILRALVILEGIGKVLHPNFNTFDFVRPYGAKIIKEQYSPENILSEAQYTGAQFLALLQTLPADIRQIVRKISKGELRVKVELSGYNTLMRKADELVSRSILALLCLGGILFSGFTLLGRYSDAMTVQPRHSGNYLVEFGNDGVFSVGFVVARNATGNGSSRNVADCLQTA